MARSLTKAPNELRLHDNLSNSVIVLYYRTPTAKEQAEYTNGMTRRERNKLVNCTGEQRQKYGAVILTGFREGDFLKQGGGVFSSDPQSPVYDPEWKGLITKFAPDLIETLAIHAFEQTASLAEGPELDDGEGGEPD
jgi:hypothetical protein